MLTGSNRRNPGFTLIELLISCSLAFMILSLLYRSYMYQLRMSEQNEKQFAVFNEGNFILSILSEELENLCFTAHQSAFSGSRDKLSFHSWTGRFKPAGHRLEQVSYGFDRTTGSMKRTSTDAKSPEVQSIEFGSNIQKVRFSYMKDGKWNDGWDKPDQLPEAVRISIVFSLHGRSMDSTVYLSRAKEIKDAGF